MIRVVPIIRSKGNIHYWKEVRKHIKTKLGFDCTKACLRMFYGPFYSIEQIAHIALEKIQEHGQDKWKTISTELKPHGTNRSMSARKLQKWYEIRGSQLAVSGTGTEAPPHKKLFTPSEPEFSTDQTCNTQPNTTENTSHETMQGFIERILNQFHSSGQDTSYNCISTIPITLSTMQPQELYNEISTIASSTAEPVLNNETQPHRGNIFPCYPYNSDSTLECEEDMISNSPKIDPPADDTLIATQTSLLEENLLEDSSISWETLCSPGAINTLTETRSEDPIQENRTSSHLPPSHRYLTSAMKYEIINLKEKHPEYSFATIAQEINKDLDPEECISEISVKGFYNKYKSHILSTQRNSEITPSATLDIQPSSSPTSAISLSNFMIKSRRTKLTSEMKRKIVDLREKDYTYSKIAEEINKGLNPEERFSASSAQYFYGKYKSYNEHKSRILQTQKNSETTPSATLDIQPSSSPTSAISLSNFMIKSHRTKLTSEMKRKIIDLREKKYSYTKIAKEINKDLDSMNIVTPTRVGDFCRKYFSKNSQSQKTVDPTPSATVNKQPTPTSTPSNSSSSELSEKTPQQQDLTNLETFDPNQFLDISHWFPEGALNELTHDDQ